MTSDKSLQNSAVIYDLEELDRVLRILQYPLILKSKIINNATEFEDYLAYLKIQNLEYPIMLKALEV